jgi:glycosyltransferase involved in cell wall biosynthesis
VFCSTIIPTVNRPSLAGAVESVLGQSLPGEDFEVIVVNDSGGPLSAADWQRSERVRIINTQRRNRSVARNTGAAIAKGRYLHFLDDDDWLLPGAFEAFAQLAHSSHAGWLYGGFQLADNTGNVLCEISPTEAGNCFVELVASEWIPLQASFIQVSAFFGAGGFASLESLLGGYEDIDLSRQIALYHDFASTVATVTRIRVGDVGSTTNYSAMFKQNRMSREKALATAASFSRMRASASARPTGRGYWHGRIIYYYLASAWWNLWHRRPLAAASRGVHGLAGLAAATWALASPDFWHGLMAPHRNRVWTALEESNAHPYGTVIWEE